jgi:2-polyprenyl-3-methyl-5-hydroxy-6-metoxy-1,4-benzoquinol methylase
MRIVEAWPLFVVFLVVAHLKWELHAVSAGNRASVEVIAGLHARVRALETSPDSLSARRKILGRLTKLETSTKQETPTLFDVKGTKQETSTLFEVKGTKQETSASKSTIRQLQLAVSEHDEAVIGLAADFEDISTNLRQLQSSVGVLQLHIIDSNGQRKIAAPVADVAAAPVNREVASEKENWHKIADVAHRFQTAPANREVPNLRQTNPRQSTYSQKVAMLQRRRSMRGRVASGKSLWTDTSTVKNSRMVVDLMLANRWADLHNPEDEDILAARPKSTEEIPKSVLRAIRGQDTSDGLFGEYGGEADKKAGRSHVGGFTFNDTATYDPDLWKWWANNLKVKTVLDIGCGMGISTDFFLRQGMKPTCLEGSNEGLSAQAKWSPYLAKYQPSIFHDFSEGDPTSKLREGFFDVGWSAEFLEHIALEYVPNVMAAFKRAHLVFVTHGQPGQAGYHHVNLQTSAWWIDKFEENGFAYLPGMTAVSKMFSRPQVPDKSWGAIRTCSYKGYEWSEDHATVAHGLQNCHTLDGELLCCSGNQNGAYPRPADGASAAFQRAKVLGRIDSMDFSMCSKRNDARFHGSGLVLLNLKSENNPYLYLQDASEARIKELLIPERLRTWYDSYLMENGYVCEWTGPEDFRPSFYEDPVNYEPVAVEFWQNAFDAAN